MAFEVGKSKGRGGGYRGVATVTEPVPNTDRFSGMQKRTRTGATTPMGEEFYTFRRGNTVGEWVGWGSEDRGVAASTKYVVSALVGATLLIRRDAASLNMVSRVEQRDGGLVGISNHQTAEPLCVYSWRGNRGSVSGSANEWCAIQLQ